MPWLSYRGRFVEWFLKELGKEDVEILNLNMKENREHKQPDFLKVGSVDSTSCA